MNIVVFGDSPASTYLVAIPSNAQHFGVGFEDLNDFSSTPLRPSGRLICV